MTSWVYTAFRALHRLFESPLCMCWFPNAYIAMLFLGLHEMVLFQLFVLTLRGCADVCAGFASIFCTSQYQPNFGMSTPYLSTSILPWGLSMSIRCSLFTFMNFLNLPPHLRPPSSKPQETCKSASFGISLETPSDTASPSFSPTGPSVPRSRSQTPARSSSAR